MASGQVIHIDLFICLIAVLRRTQDYFNYTTRGQHNGVKKPTKAQEKLTTLPCRSGKEKAYSGCIVEGS